MRLLPTTLAVLLVPTVAFSQNVKQVEVTNLPAVQDVTGTVEVTNTPVPVEVTNAAEPARFQLVGFTTTTYLGDVGLFAFSRGCHAEFPHSRMCRSKEVVETVTISSGLATTAWLQPSVVAGGIGGATFPPLRKFMDASGVAGRDDSFSCGPGPTWSLTTGSGLAVDFEGRFGFQPCSVAQAVACCALVP